MNLFQWHSDGVQLHSGQTSNLKIDCDALTDEDWATLAKLAVQMLHADPTERWNTPFSHVVSVPTGGNKLAAALQPYMRPDAYEPYKGKPVGYPLICDDVLTTGASMNAMRASGLESMHPAGCVAGIVVFARGPLPVWVKAIFTLSEERP